MKEEARRWLLRAIDALYQVINRHIIFRQSAQEAHERVIRLLSLLERIPFAIIAARFLHTVCFSKRSTEVGGAKLSQRMILAAGLVKGEGFVNEEVAMRAVKASRRNIIPGWRIVPALLGPVEFGSFTRQPRLGESRGGAVAAGEDAIDAESGWLAKSGGARGGRISRRAAGQIADGVRHQYRGVAGRRKH